MKQEELRRCTVALLLLCCLSPACTRSGEDGVRHPNIVFFLTDDHACEAVGSYGSALLETPNLDRLASEGIRFDQCFAVESICRPSRTAILTGKYGHVTGATGWNMYDRARHKTFPEYLREGGYATALFGKYHIGSAPAGFDDWAVLPGQGRYHDPEFLTSTGKKTIEGHVSDVVVDLAMDWMQRRDREKPFLICINDKSVHMPFIPPDRWKQHFKGNPISEPGSLFWDLDHPQHPVSRSDLLIDSLQHWQRSVWGTVPEGLSFEERRRWIYQVYMQYYLGGVKAIDENVGRFLEYLEENGLDDNTIVVYSSDQGFFLGQKNLFDKRWMYEPSIRMPLIIKYPGMQMRSGVVDKIVLNIDLAPTILEIAGIGVPADMQGMSLKPMLEGQTDVSWRNSMYYRLYVNEYNVPPHFGIRTERYKLIHFDGKGDPLNKKKTAVDYDVWELYDLEEDPEELHNVANDQSYSPVFSTLRRDLEALKTAVGDTLQHRTKQ